MGLMTYGAQIAAGVGSLWNHCHLPLGFTNTTLWREELCLVGFNGCQMITKGVFSWSSTYLVILNARQKSVLDILSNGHFVSICSHRRYRSLPSAHSARRDLFAARHLLMGSPCHWLYGTRKWSEWAFNYFIVNAGCQEGKDMIGFDYWVTAAEKKKRVFGIFVSSLWSGPSQSTVYHFALKLLDYIRSSLSRKGSGFFSVLLHFPVHMLPSRSEKRVTLPLLAGRGKCAALWQMNDVKQTYLYSFRAEEEENPSVTDVMGTAMCECACI